MRLLHVLAPIFMPLFVTAAVWTTLPLKRVLSLLLPFRLPSSIQLKPSILSLLCHRTAKHFNFCLCLRQSLSMLFFIVISQYCRLHFICRSTAYSSSCHRLNATFGARFKGDFFFLEQKKYGKWLFEIHFGSQRTCDCRQHHHPMANGKVSYNLQQEYLQKQLHQ